MSLPPILVDQDASKFIAQCGYMYRDESTISNTLKCPICSDPWIEPVVASTCGHMFCEKCIKTWVNQIPTCPVDRSLLYSNQLAKPPKILSDLVDELTVMCSLGCGWEGKREEWKDHLERYCEEVDSERTTEDGYAVAKATSLDEKREKAKSLNSVEGDEIQEDAPEKEDEAIITKDKWRKLTRDVALLRKEAKDYQATIAIWRDKVEKLQLELQKALEAAPVPPSPKRRSSSSVPSSPTASVSSFTLEPRHQATCDFCRCHIHGTRYKCFKCPDLDSCSDCFHSISILHAGHDFAPIRDPHEVKVITLPEWKIVHPNIICNHCNQSVVGPRFKCTICSDFDLCNACMAMPRPSHPKSHPMTRYVEPCKR